MPELPEVETTLRGIEKILHGQTIKTATVRVPKLRFKLQAGLARALTGQKIVALERRAKYILCHLNSGQTLLLHLGMSGRLTKAPAAAPLAKHDHLILQTAKHTVRFNDPRRFGMAELIPTAKLTTHKLLQHLGPEPLGRALTPAYLAGALARKASSIKQLLLNQKIIAGLGNIYVSEALFYARIHPKRLGKTLQPAEIARLVPAIKKVLHAAIKAGGSSLRDYVQTDGKLGFFQDQFAVYDRANQRCPGCTCGQPAIQKIVQAGRATYFCPVQQPAKQPPKSAKTHA